MLEIVCDAGTRTTYSRFGRGNTETRMAQRANSTSGGTGHFHQLMQYSKACILTHITAGTDRSATLSKCDQDWNGVIALYRLGL